ncbi:MAG TPA: pyridoxal-phosphate dependent enzyme [Bacteroidales bacterium]|nr:pyridoxal-phosphate dependent enzyme [Bacteroidales bacterium]
MNTLPPIDAGTIQQAASLLLGRVNRTPVYSSQTLNRVLDSEVFFKCENLQKAGAFKSRGATHAILRLSNSQLAKGVATHSSGNHAQALARAAALAGTAAYIVMPSNSSRVKIAAVQEYGGRITFCEPTLEARETTLAGVLAETGATEIHPYNNEHIIAGQATAALELIEEVLRLDLVMAPVGGGGLLSGTALAVHFFSPGTQVIAAEPEQANDAYLSFRSREFVPSVHPDTLADGLRTSLGSLTFPLILNYVDDIVTVSEQSIVDAMRYLWERLKILAEPSSAVPLAAIMEGKVDVKGKRIGIIISGGNVDLDHLPW